MKKDENLKEKFKQALISTVRAISEDFNRKILILKKKIIVQKTIIFLN